MSEEKLTLHEAVKTVLQLAEDKWIHRVRKVNLTEKQEEAISLVSQYVEHSTITSKAKSIVNLHVLKKTDCDGNSLMEKWEEHPTEQQLLSLLDDYHDVPKAKQLAMELMHSGIVDVGDGASTQYEIERI